MVLIFRLTLSQDRISRKTHPVDFLYGSGAVALDQHGIEGGRTGTSVFYGVDIGHPHVRKPVHESLDVVSFGVLIFFHVSIDLTGDDVAEFLTEEVIGGVVVDALEVGEKAEGLLIVHHAGDGAGKRLGTDRGPDARLLDVFLGPYFGVVCDVHAFQKVGPVMFEECLKVEEGRDTEGISLSLKVRLGVGDVLAVVGRHDVPRQHVLDGRRVGYTHEE
mmetsp:Transcript_15120/g.33777  ORF Transcript_15120/g.33777 Transcript_15120/m.33777 type:complete len:218 (-) Transcript_15120:3853-4506(-)